MWTTFLFGNDFTEDSGPGPICPSWQASDHRGFGRAHIVLAKAFDDAVNEGMLGQGDGVRGRLCFR